VTTIRLAPSERRDKVLAATLPLAIAKGYDKLTRDEIAEAAGISGGTLGYHFGSVDALRVALVEYALAKRCLPVIAQALVARDPAVAEIPARLRSRALSAYTRPA
jgi:AcrR family transcriptional regulator